MSADDLKAEGIELYKRFQFEAALAAFEAGLEAATEPRPDLAGNKAAVLFELGRYSEAAAAAEAAAAVADACGDERRATAGRERRARAEAAAAAWAACVDALGESNS